MDDVRRAVLGIPGFAFFRKRGEEIIEDHPQPEVHPGADARRDGLALAATFRP